MRSATQPVLFIFCALLLSSCEFKCSVGDTNDKPFKGKTVSSSIIEKDGTIITNNIDLTAIGVKVKKATLLLVDNTQVPDDNIVGLNQKIKLVLFIDSGWTEKNGKAFIGAAEKMASNNGDVIVDAADLFADYSTNGLDAEDAKTISVNAVISKETDQAKYYTVNFRVWDKLSNAEITGNYKFYIKH